MPKKRPLHKRIGSAARRYIIRPRKAAEESAHSGSDLDELDGTFTEEQAARMPPKRPNPLEDSFELGGKIGSGSFGNVKKTRRLASDQWAASKEITEVKKKRHLIAIEREIEILQELDHPNIVKYYESFRMEGKRVFINMELCAADLETFLEGLTSPMDLMYIKYILQSILRACEHMHSRRVVHRDLKPANILITDDGIIKISDFGLARHFEKAEHGRVRHYSSCGTPHYEAPEMRRNETDYGWEVDIWSVGCIAHDLYFGEGLNKDCKKTRDIIHNIRRYCGVLPDGTRKVLSRVITESGGDMDHHDLFFHLLMTDQKSRPPADYLLKLPYFHCGTKPATKKEMSEFFLANHKKHVLI